MCDKKISDTGVETIHLVRPEHLNDAGRLFGGVLMQWMDEIAALAAMQYYEGNVVTGTVDSLVFIKGASKGDMVYLTARITYTGRKSIEVKVDVHVRHLNGRMELINQAYFVMVALPKEDGVPVTLKPEGNSPKRETGRPVLTSVSSAAVRKKGYLRRESYGRRYPFSCSLSGLLCPPPGPVMPHIRSECRLLLHSSCTNRWFSSWKYGIPGRIHRLPLPESQLPFR